MNKTADDADAGDETIAELRRRTIATMHRCIFRLVKEIARDHETCPRQSCRRARRCRGMPCLWD